MIERGDFSRQSFLGAEAEEMFASTRIVIAGLGGGGSHEAQQFAHIGLGHQRLIDPDRIEASNLNRLVTATREDVDEQQLKVRILERAIRAVRPWADVIVAAQPWQEADELLKDAHAVFGCLDGYRQRHDLERAARRFMLPYFDIGMDVTALADGTYAIAGQVIVSLPGHPCMTCMGFLTQEKLNQEEADYGDAGINPQVVWANGVLASTAVGLFVQMAAPWCGNGLQHPWLEYDGNQHTVTSSPHLKYNVKGPCRHFDNPDDLGDPFFRLDGKRP